MKNKIKIFYKMADGNENKDRKYSLSKPTTPLTQGSKPSNPSSFLARMANEAIRDSGGQAPKPQGPKFMASSIDHSSPQANLASRLKWVETAFKPENVRAPLNHKMRPPEQMQQAQQVPATQAPSAVSPRQEQQVAQVSEHAEEVAKMAVITAVEFKSAVELMRRRMQTLRAEMDQLERELADIHAKIQ